MNIVPEILIAIVPTCLLCQTYANSVGVKLLRLIQVQSIKKISSLLVYVHYYEIRHFHFVVVPKRQRNVQKGVMPAFLTFSLVVGS